ncbi:MAG TPA: thioesterase family protein [Candidatus Thermoplasmatota archaeon]|nr:thioesterase family protein [Candidatus Thermoplasmatota archaeon]
MAGAASPWPVTMEIKVPWRDIDVAGHLNNAIYFSYMETARVEAFLRVTGGSKPQEIYFIVARAACDFHSPVYMHETLLVKVWPTRVGTTSFTFKYEMTEKTSGRAVATGETVQVMYDYAKRSKKPIPPELRKVLEAA